MENECHHRSWRGSDGTWWERHAPRRFTRPLRRSRIGRGKRPGPSLGFFSWILLLPSGEFRLLPNFHAFYASSILKLLWKVALFGAMWGVGNVSYGLTMRHLGMSLGIGVAIGVTLVVGTLVPPMMHGQFMAICFHPQRPAGTWPAFWWRSSAWPSSPTPGTRKKMQLGAEVQEFNVDARPGAGRDVRHLFVGLFISGLMRPAPIAQRCATALGVKSALTRGCPVTCSSWAAARS